MITKDSIIGDVLDQNAEQVEELSELFYGYGMHCLYCPSARGESIEDACAVHGTNADELVEKINALLSAKAK